MVQSDKNYPPSPYTRVRRREGDRWWLSSGWEWYNTLFLLDGYYIYLETSSGRSGSKAQLQSPNFNINRGQRKCLSLWFHMYGPNVGYLNVYLKKNGVLGRPIWQRNGNKGNQWRQGTINIPTNTNIQNAQVNINILETINL